MKLGRKNRPTIPYYYIRGHTKKIDISKEIETFSYCARSIISEKRTMLHFDRLYTLFQVMASVPTGSTSLEVGVYKGGTLKFLSKIIDGRDVHLIGIDTFEGHVDSLPKDVVHKNSLQFVDASFEDVKQYLSDFPNTVIVKSRVQDLDFSLIQKLGFIHLDTDLYSPTLWVLDNLSSKLVKGGVIVIDDYGHKTTPGVLDAVKEFLARSGQNFFFLHLITGQGVLVRL
jgi:hypothetical protein